jgi:RimJ/RimL family protein N-acetyltransferase
MKLREHTITLRSERVVLRPMTEDDWDILLKWNSDPQVLYYSEGDDVQAYSFEDIQGIYRGVSQSAFCFVAEVNHNPPGFALHRSGGPILRSQRVSEITRIS